MRDPEVSSVCKNPNLEALIRRYVWTDASAWEA